MSEDGGNALSIMRLPMHVNNVKIQLVVDTGAVVSLMNLQDYKTFFHTTVSYNCTW